MWVTKSTLYVYVKHIDPANNSYIHQHIYPYIHIYEITYSFDLHSLIILMDPKILEEPVHQLPDINNDNNKMIRFCNT